MKKLLLPFAILASTACGDTYNNTYVVEEKSSETIVELNNCEDVAAHSYECDSQKYEKYREAWGTSIEDQIRYAVNECEKVGFFQNAPKWISCVEQSSCEEFNAGKCDPYMIYH